MQRAVQPMAEMTWQAGDLSLALQTKPSHDSYQEVIFATTRGGFSATRSSRLDSGDIGRFANQVHRMWQELAGDAELYGEDGVEFSPADHDYRRPCGHSREHQPTMGPAAHRGPDRPDLPTSTPRRPAPDTLTTPPYRPRLPAIGAHLHDPGLEY
jgi:hypothetical protein